MKKTLDPSNNKFLSGGEHSFFMAFKGKKPVARILAGINAPMTQKTGIVWSYFSLFEAENEESGKAVLDAAAEYCKSHGAVKLLGPFSPTNGEDSRGLLVEGFDGPPVLLSPYNPPWYKELFEKYGLQKYRDLYAFKIETVNTPLERFRKGVNYAKKRYKFDAKKADLNNFEGELKDIYRILTESTPSDWDTGVPTWEQVREEGKTLKSMADPDYVYIARTQEGRPIAFVVALPNYNEILIHMNGRLLPFGILKYLYWRKRIKGLRILMQFCVPDYQAKGAISVCYLYIMEIARQKGCMWGEASAIGEENVKSLAAVEGVGGVRYRTFRWFMKDL